MSHKTKAQKVDLAAFLREQPGDDLPSGPDPNREPYDRDRGRGGRGGERGFDRGGDRGGRGSGRGGFGDRGRGDEPSRGDEVEDDAGPWQRAGPSGRAGRNDRGGGFGGDRGGGFGGDRGGGFGGDRDRGFGGDRDRGFGGDRDRGFGGRSDGPPPPPAGERPRLNLEQRTLPPPTVASVSTKMENLSTQEPQPSTDKWDNLFKKSRAPAGTSTDAPSDSRRGGFNDRGDRRGGYGDRGGDRGYGGDRGGDRGYGGDRGGDRGYGGDRGGGFGGDRRGYGDRGGYTEKRGFASTNRYETDPGPIDDPRFAGKFTGSNSRTPKVDISSIPTIAVPEKREDPKAEERKAAQEEKLQKAAAKAEAERKAKEEQLARKEAELAAIETQMSDAAVLIASGTKGQDLLDKIKGYETKPAGAALLAALLPTLTSVDNITWTNPEEYGLPLSALLHGNDREQMLFIYELQKHCYKHNFPRLQTKTGQRSLIDILFQLLYKNDILEASGIMKWWDDEEFDEIPGRSDALVQVTTFVNWLNEEDEEEEAEEEEYEGLEPAPRNAA